jgi:hypothetical protein
MRCEPNSLISIIQKYKWKIAVQKDIFLTITPGAKYSIYLKNYQELFLNFQIYKLQARAQNSRAATVGQVSISFPEPAILGKEREALGYPLPDARNPG